MKSLRLSWLLWSALLFFVLVGTPRPAAANSLSNTWMGTINNDWFTYGNWSHLTVPDSSTPVTNDVTIVSGGPVIGATPPTAYANNIKVYSGGTLTLDSNANLSLGGNLTFDAGSVYTAGSGATITLTGSDVYIYSSNVDMSNTTLSFTNPSASDTLDVGVAGFNLGTLKLTGGATVTLEGNSATVGTLDLGGNSTLDLNGFQLYYLQETLGTGVTFQDGTPQQEVVPLPGSAWLLLSGLAGLAGWRRLRKS